jgi:hypothetical protein
VSFEIALAGIGICCFFDAKIPVEKAVLARVASAGSY